MSVFDRAPWIRDHIHLYRTDPMAAHYYAPPGGTPKPSLFLTTKGRTTGEFRQVPLIYGGWGKGFVIVASLGGAPDHPFWYKNLDADPNAHIQVGYNHFDVTARVAKGDERKILWDMMVGILPQYVEYAKSTEGKREIPVVVLDPKYDG